MTQHVPESLSLLSADEILIAEFSYIAQTAGQANEDRVRVTAQYFITIGTILVAIVSVAAAPLTIAIQTSVRVAFSIIFLVLSILSFFTILQLVRLRLAWCESARAMSTIKEHYCKVNASSDIERAFRWTKSSIPPAFKKDSISTILAIQVSLLGGLTSGSCVFFVCLLWDFSEWPWSILIGISFSIIQFVSYRYLLK